MPHIFYFFFDYVFFDLSNLKILKTRTCALCCLIFFVRASCWFCQENQNMWTHTAMKLIRLLMATMSKIPKHRHGPWCNWNRFVRTTRVCFCCYWLSMFLHRHFQIKSCPRRRSLKPGVTVKTHKHQVVLFEKTLPFPDLTLRFPVLLIWLERRMLRQAPAGWRQPASIWWYRTVDHFQVRYWVRQNHAVKIAFCIVCVCAARDLVQLQKLFSAGSFIFWLWCLPQFCCFHWSCTKERCWLQFVGVSIQLFCTLQAKLKHRHVTSNM